MPRPSRRRATGPVDDDATVVRLDDILGSGTDPAAPPLEALDGPGDLSPADDETYEPVRRRLGLGTSVLLVLLVFAVGALVGAVAQKNLGRHPDPQVVVLLAPADPPSPGPAPTASRTPR